MEVFKPELLQKYMNEAPRWYLGFSALLQCTIAVPLQYYTE